MFNHYMELCGPEFIRNTFLDEETEYIEDFRQRFDSAPVFEDATNFQRELQATRLTKEDFLPCWASVRATIEALDSTASQQGIMYENVSLKGEGIRTPKLDMDLATNIALMSLVDKEKQRELALHKYLQQDEYRGKFFGFTMYFSETEDENVFVPVLAYRVSMQMIHSPNAEITLFTTGDVGTTQLHFNNDERLEGSLGLLNKLFELCPSESKSINLISMALAGPKPYDASLIRHVGYHAEKIVLGIDPQKRFIVENALIDLITNYLDKESSYKIESTKLTLLKTSDAKLTLHESEKADNRIKNKYIDVVFRDQEMNVDGEMKTKNRRTIQLAFPAQGDIAFVSLTKLHLFEKL